MVFLVHPVILDLKETRAVTEFLELLADLVVMERKVMLDSALLVVLVSKATKVTAVWMDSTAQLVKEDHQVNVVILDKLVTTVYSAHQVYLVLRFVFSCHLLNYDSLSHFI